jgi:hypothetical protein
LTATDNKGNTSTAAGPVTDGPANPPPAPTIFIVSPGSQEVLLDWAPSAPVTGESLPISYILTFSGAHSGSVTLPSTQTSYLDDNGGAGFTDPASVNYSLQVVDASGITSSPAHASTVTGPIPATTGSGNLNPPSGLTAKAISSKAVSLTWTPPNDLGRVVVSYQLFRSENFTTSFASITTFANSALTPTTSYIDTTAQPGKTYYYVLQAGYLQGPATVYSSNSNHAFDTTPLPTTTPPPVGVSQMGFDANLLTPLSGQTLGIYYVVPTDGAVEIDIYNISGNIIRVLYPGQATANVTTQTTWDGTDRNGKVVASGLYFIEIKSPGFHQVKKVAVVK